MDDVIPLVDNRILLPLLGNMISSLMWVIVNISLQFTILKLCNFGFIYLDDNKTCIINRIRQIKISMDDNDM